MLVAMSVFRFRFSAPVVWRLFEMKPRGDVERFGSYLRCAGLVTKK